MGTRKIEKLRIDPKWFKWVLAQCGVSIRSLGKDEQGIGWSSKSVQRALSERLISPDLLEAIAKRLNVHPDYLAGELCWQLDVLPDEDSREEFKRCFLRPDQHPYRELEQERLGIRGYIDATLLIHGVDKSDYEALARSEREELFQALDRSVTGVLRRWFPDCDPVSAIEYRESCLFETDDDVIEAMLSYFEERGMVTISRPDEG